MRADIYRAMAQAEDTHWWFRARRSIIARVLRKHPLPAEAVILDAGSGTGGNLAMLAQFGKVCAMEMDAGARALANNRHVVKVREGKLPDTIPFEGQSFDLILLSDVLEHIDDDAGTLAALKARLNAGGRLLITVPAFAFLWSMHDVVHHHKRRYTLSALTRLVEGAGCRVTLASYINFWLFPLIAMVRVFDRVTGGKLLGYKPGDNAELAIPPAPVNRFLEAVFASEPALFPFMRLPFGVSILLVAKKV